MVSNTQKPTQTQEEAQLNDVASMTRHVFSNEVFQHTHLAGTGVILAEGAQRHNCFSLFAPLSDMLGGAGGHSDSSFNFANSTPPQTEIDNASSCDESFAGSDTPMHAETTQVIYPPANILVLFCEQTGYRVRGNCGSGNCWNISLQDCIPLGRSGRPLAYALGEERGLDADLMDCLGCAIAPVPGKIIPVYALCCRHISPRG